MSRPGRKPRDASGATVSRGLRLTPAQLERTELAAELVGEPWGTWAARVLDSAAADAGATAGIGTLDDVLDYLAAERPPGHQADLLAALCAVLHDPRLLRGAIGLAWAQGRGPDLVRICERHSRRTEG